MNEYFVIEGIHFETGKNVKIRISEGLIESVEEVAPGGKNMNIYIAPGLIDNQINGYAGVDFSGNELSQANIRHATEQILSEGVTSFLPTLATNSHQNLIKNFSILAETLDNDPGLALSIPGFHLEGPYISAEDGYRGCHPLQHIRKPSRTEFLEYQKAAKGRIIQVTLAPETEGALEFIKFCVQEGIVVAIGHSNASAEQIYQAVDAGARLSTHLGNGCANVIPRHLNPIWPQLSNDKLTPSIIADGQHLLPEEIRVFFKTKGAENIIITSDVVYLAGMKPGRYTFLEGEVILTEAGMLVNPGSNTLAGASFPIRIGVGNVIKFTGCSLATAINMASRNVAAIYKLNDRGELVSGKRADVILFELSDNRLKIIRTYVKGNLVYQ